MENVVILTQAEYKALNDNIDDLYKRAKLASNSGSKYYAGRGVQVTADEYINGLLKQIAELTQEESHKDTLWCEAVDGVTRLQKRIEGYVQQIDALVEVKEDVLQVVNVLRDDLAKHNIIICHLENQIAELEEELGDKDEKLALYNDIIDGISYELNRV